MMKQPLSLLSASLPWALALFMTAACGDSDDPADADADAGVDADAAVDTPDADTGPTATIIAVGGDYAGNGVLTSVTLPDMTVTVNAVAGVVGGDPAIRRIGERLFILDRFGGDSVTVLDLDLELLGQFSTGAGTNPQDVAVVGNKLYIAALASSDLLIADLDDISGGVTGTIDLSSLDQDDDVPDCNSLHASGDTLFVSCQIMNTETFSPRGNGKVAVVDTTNDSLSSTINLSAQNPFALMEEMSNGNLVFSTAPGALFGGNNDTGCAEQINTAGTPTSGDCLSVNMDLASYPGDFAVDGDKIYMTGVESFTETTVYKANSPSESFGAISLPGAGATLTGIATCPTGHLVVNDATDGAKGLRVYDSELQALEPGLIDVGWPMAFFPANSTVCF